MAIIPTLETQRLRLRPHKPDDLDACTFLWSDPIVTRYIGGRPFTREEVWARLLRYTGHWHWMGYGFWVLEESASGRFLGEIGLAEFKRDVHPPVCEGPEAGWVLLPEAHGNGFATEALTAITQWHDARAPQSAITCIIHPDNLASVRVATKCSFKQARQTLYKGQPSSVFVRPSQAAQSLYA